MMENETIRAVRFTAESSQTVSFVQTGSTGITPNLEYSTDGHTWSAWDLSELSFGGSVRLYVRGINTRFATSTSNYWHFVFGNSTSVMADGDCNCLLDYEQDVTTFVGRTHVFLGLFNGCSVLLTAPSLPAETLSAHCYRSMFQGCTSLVNAPKLPATVLGDYCYRDMFNGCSSLVIAPKLPAQTLRTYCYQAMFYNCTSLTVAPDLSVLTTVAYCYHTMFYGCTSLVDAPKLPATTLTNYCYYAMFQRCTAILTAPDLPATTLANYCYQLLFQGCSSLSSVRCLATDISATDCTKNWMYGVASSGTFTKATGVTWATGVNGIPSNWSVNEE